VAAKFLVVNL